MIVFARFAYFTLVRDTGFVALAAGLLMLAFSFEPPMAFDVGATVALVFALGLLVRVLCLTESRFTRSEPGAPCRTRNARSATKACAGRAPNWNA